MLVRIIHSCTPCGLLVLDSSTVDNNNTYAHTQPSTSTRSLTMTSTVQTAAARQPLAPVNGSRLHVLTSTPSDGTSTPTMAPSRVQTKIGVFCAASFGKSEAHMAAAHSLAEAFHKHNVHLGTYTGEPHEF